MLYTSLTEHDIWQMCLTRNTLELVELVSPLACHLNYSKIKLYSTYLFFSETSTRKLYFFLIHLHVFVIACHRFVIYAVCIAPFVLSEARTRQFQNKKIKSFLLHHEPFVELLSGEYCG